MGVTRPANRVVLRKAWARYTGSSANASSISFVTPPCTLRASQLTQDSHQQLFDRLKYCERCASCESPFFGRRPPERGRESAHTWKGRIALRFLQSREQYHRIVTLDR